MRFARKRCILTGSQISTLYNENEASSVAKIWPTIKVFVDVMANFRYEYLLDVILNYDWFRDMINYLKSSNIYIK
jgi:hypothetical protein